MIGLRQTDIGFLCLAPVQPITGSVTGLCRGNVEGFLRGCVLFGESQLDLGLLFSHRDTLHCLLCLFTGLPTLSPTDVHECFQPVSFVVLDV